MEQTRLFDSSVQKLIEGLNVDLVHEYASAIMYTNYVAVASGIHAPMLRSFFEAEIRDEQEHAQYLAAKIQTLGGTPVTTLADIPQTFEVRSMLEAARDAEAATIEQYIERRQQAEALGMIELLNQLDDLIDDETGHKEQIERMLEETQLF